MSPSVADNSAARSAGPGPDAIWSGLNAIGSDLNAEWSGLNVTGSGLNAAWSGLNATGPGLNAAWTVLKAIGRGRETVLRCPNNKFGTKSRPVLNRAAGWVDHLCGKLGICERGGPLPGLFIRITQRACALST